MIAIYMCVTECVHEIRRFQITFPGDQAEQERVARNIERDTEEDICASLIKLKAEFSINHIELEESMTWREGHRIDFRRMPCCDDVPPGIRVVDDAVNDVFELIGKRAVRSFPCPPLSAVDIAEITVFFCECIFFQYAFFKTFHFILVDSIE